jgi:hypothetical protein
MREYRWYGPPPLDLPRENSSFNFKVFKQELIELAEQIQAIDSNYQSVKEFFHTRSTALDFIKYMTPAYIEVLMQTLKELTSSKIDEAVAFALAKDIYGEQLTASQTKQLEKKLTSKHLFISDQTERVKIWVISHVKDLYNLCGPAFIDILFESNDLGFRLQEADFQTEHTLRIALDKHSLRTNNAFRISKYNGELALVYSTEKDTLSAYWRILIQCCVANLSALGESSLNLFDSTVFKIRVPDPVAVQELTSGDPLIELLSALAVQRKTYRSIYKTPIDLTDRAISKSGFLPLWLFAQVRFLKFNTITNMFVRGVQTQMPSQTLKTRTATYTQGPVFTYHTPELPLVASPEYPQSLIYCWDTEYLCNEKRWKLETSEIIDADKSVLFNYGLDPLLLFTNAAIGLAKATDYGLPTVTFHSDIQDTSLVYLDSDSRKALVGVLNLDQEPKFSISLKPKLVEAVRIYRSERSVPSLDIEAEISADMCTLLSEIDRKLNR